TEAPEEEAGKEAEWRAPGRAAVAGGFSLANNSLSSLMFGGTADTHPCWRGRCERCRLAFLLTSHWRRDLVKWPECPVGAGVVWLMNEVTSILSAIEAGDPQAAAELLPLVYDELRKLAAVRLADEKPGHTLQPTALVHEAYLRLVGDGQPR